ncbi:MAG: SAM-dependent chlorinase/fluorinase [Pirellulales bacterium]
MPSIITLTTDFGRDSPYVAAMKGVILSINPAATIVDISHGIAPQNIVEGAFVLGETTRWFPPGSIHVAVVDPGVGTERRIIYARVAGRQYVCPDNGLLSYVCRDQPPEQAIEVTNRSLFLAEVSNTFHGRDIMAPVAAHLSLGFPPHELGPAVNRINLLDWPRPERRDNAVMGRVLCADSFGNLITNIRRDDLPNDIEPASFFVETAQQQFDGIVKTYLESPSGTPVALFGSSGLLELAIVQGNAALQLQIPIGDNLGVTWKE